MRNYTDICDRCKKEQPPGQWLGSLIGRLRSIHWYSWTNNDQKAELCSDCLDELDAWLHYKDRQK